MVSNVASFAKSVNRTKSLCVAIKLEILYAKMVSTLIEIVLFRIISFQFFTRMTAAVLDFSSLMRTVIAALSALRYVVSLYSIILTTKKFSALDCSLQSFRCAELRECLKYINSTNKQTRNQSDRHLHQSVYFNDHRVVIC